jgi:hypothetical protein
MNQISERAILNGDNKEVLYLRTYLNGDRKKLEIELGGDEKLIYFIERSEVERFCNILMEEFDNIVK